MSPKEFIENKLKELKSTNKTVAIFTSDKELGEFIFKTIMSKKFRKFSITGEYISHIQESIEINIKNNSPIKILWPFGAYKLWRLEEAPEADWAELFSIMYFAKWIMPITEVYKPGVWFDFSSDEIVVERMNNIPKSDTESYAKSFSIVLNFIKSYLPENLKFTLTPVSSYYTPEEFEEDLKDKLDKMQKELGGLPVLSERDKRMVELNVRLNPGQSNDPLWREKVELIHQAFYTITKRRAYNRAKDKFWAFATPIGDCVTIGTTKTSVAKFWPGVGALKKNENDYQEYVLSPSQIENTKFDWEPISIDGLDGKNFHKIRII